MKQALERNATDPVLGPCLFRVDAVLSGAATVEILQGLARELEGGHSAERLLFVWESLVLRTGGCGRQAPLWWSPQNYFALEKRQIASTAALDLQKASAWLTSRPGWQEVAFRVYLALKDDERGGLLS